MAVVCFDKNNVNDSNDVFANLEGTTSVKELSIAGIFVDDCAMDSLSSVLRQNTFSELQVLKLPRNSLTAACCNSLAHVILSLASLRELDVSDNKLGEFPGSLVRRESSGSMCSHQSNSSVSRQKRSLTGDGLAKLVEALSQSSCELITLQLSNNKLGPKSATSLAALISRATSLRNLDVSNNALGTKTIKTLIPALLDNSWLETLDLGYNNISNSGASLLAAVLDPGDSHSRLRELNLTFNKIGPAGAHSLARSLLTNRCLFKLDLSLNRIGPEGSECFGPVLRYSHTLQELILSRNNIGEGGQGVLRLLEGLEATEGTNLKLLDLSWNALTDDTALRIASLLSGNAVLKSLNLSSNAIGNRGVKALAEALVYDVGLRELNIVGNQADDTSVEALSKVIRHPSSAQLSLLWESNNFSAAGKRKLESALAFRCHMTTWLGRCLRDIERRSVVSLNLEDVPLGDEELNALTGHLVKHAPRVKALRALGDQLTSYGVHRLARDVIAPNHVSLERLFLSHARIMDAGSGALAQAVLTNTSLRILSLVSCGITSEGAKMLSNALRRNSHIQMLTLQGNDLGDAGAREVFSAVLDKVDPNVLSLNLCSCNITDDGMFLPPIRKLESLFLSQNRISDAGALDVAKACIGCRSLAWLDCSENKISWKGLHTMKLFLPVICAIVSDQRASDQRANDVN